MRNITKLIVHCSATPNDRNITVEEIRSWHLARGWSDIGYHYVISRDGKILCGRPVGIAGAHCQGHNFDSVGVCLVGDDEFNPVQFKALQNLYAMLKGFYPDMKAFGHRDFTDLKTCPNFEVKDYLK